MRAGSIRRRACGLAVFSMTGALLAYGTPVTAQAAVPGSDTAHTATRRTMQVAPDGLTDPGRLLPAGWHTSRDVAVAVAGDATGLHVLVADEARGYAWRTIATLSVPGTDTAQWIGQACVTGGGQRAVVVYAPADITTTPDALDRGALAAVVNLSDGKVTPIGAGVSIAYFNPGCGTGQDAVLTQGGWGTSMEVGRADVTRLMMVSAVTGKIRYSVVLPGEVASAVPYQGNIAAVYSTGIVSIGRRGQVRTLVRTVGTSLTGVPFRLSPDRAGGLGYQIIAGSRVQVRRYAGGRNVLVGTAGVGAVDLSQIGGQVFVTGPAAAGMHRLPPAWHAVNAPAQSQVSTTGALAVLASATDVPGGQGSRAAGGPPASAQPVRLASWIASTGKSVVFTAPASSLPAYSAFPRALPGFPALEPAKAPASGATGRAQAAAGPGVSPPPSNVNPATTTYDPDRACSVPRNDPTIETYQPDDQQIQWATDEAVRGDLTDTRPADLFGSGLPAYSPQGLFPLPRLDGGGSIPPQVMLGIETTESSLYQASDHVIIGEAGNFEPSYSWYGDEGNYTYVDWADSDCGYGIAQITSGMCLAGYSGCTNPMPYEDQLAIAVDYQANIAAGVQLLADKWNELYADGIKANGADAKYIEDWYFAIWDYNSGLEPNAANGNKTGCTPGPKCTDSDGNWGLGWADNPANDAYPPDRPSFLNQSGAKAPDGGSYVASWELAHPQYWPYQEKVIGFAFDAYSNWSFLDQAYVKAYDWGKWRSGTAAPAIAPHTEFCTKANHCDPARVKSGSVKTRGNPCLLTGAVADHCWWHWSASWADCAKACGTGVFAYPANASEPRYPGVPPGYPPACTAKPLASSAVIVGDVPSSIPAPLGCGESWSNNGGTMTFNFAANDSTSPPTYPSKIDFHQVAAGYGGHFWFTHTMAPRTPVTAGCLTPSVPDLEVTGTWTPPSSVQGWTDIWAALPNVGADATQAMYQITTSSTAARQLELMNQYEGVDSWEELGEFDLGPGASISLSNVTCNGSQGTDIAWDAMAFIPVKPYKADYVAMGDSYSSGEGVQPFYPDSDKPGDACHRSTSAYPTLVKLPGQSTPIAAQAAENKGAVFSFIACSGAETTGITADAVDKPETKYDRDGNTDWGHVQATAEGLQDDQGKLTGNTTLVTLSIGGNDIRFADVLFGCLTTKGNCSAKNFVLKRHSNNKLDPEPLGKFEPKVISDLLPPHLLATYVQIHDLAPDAEIIVLGYPLLFTPSPTRSCTVGKVLGIVRRSLSVDDQKWLNDMGNLLNRAIATEVTYARVHYHIQIYFVNPAPAFKDHEICSAHPWIYGLLSASKSGSGRSIVNPGSFHPNKAGQAEFADLVNQCIANYETCNARVGS